MELCLTSTKGLGLFAKDDIQRGTRIISEAPLRVIHSGNEGEEHKSLRNALSTLSSAKLDAFYSLSTNRKLLSRKHVASVTKHALALPRFRKDKSSLAAFVEADVKGYLTYVNQQGPGSDLH